MRRLLYSKAANQDLVDIARFVRHGSGSHQTAIEFVSVLRSQCRRLAELPGILGRSRPEIRPDARSFAARSYVIVFRYEDDVVEIIRLIERHRDIGAQFDKNTD